LQLIIISLLLMVY